MKGFVAAELGHIVNVLPPVDITGGKVGQRFSMANHAHATVIFQVGVSANAFTKLFVKACSDFQGTGAEAIPFAVYKQETTAGDVLGPREAVSDAGLTPASDDNIFYVIELDAAELPDGKPIVEISATNGSNSVLASCVAILSGSRYAGPESATVTS